MTPNRMRITLGLLMLLAALDRDPALQHWVAMASFLVLFWAGEPWRHGGRK